MQPDCAGAPELEWLASQIAAVVRTAALSATDKWCSSILLPSGLIENAKLKRLDCVCGIRCAAKPGELVRVDFNEFGSVAASERVRALLIDEIQPFIIGVGNIIAKEMPEGVVILLGNLGDINCNHEITSEMIEAGADAIYELREERVAWSLAEAVYRAMERARTGLQKKID
jgi:hypothetical protein